MRGLRATAIVPAALFVMLAALAPAVSQESVEAESNASDAKPAPVPQPIQMARIVLEGSEVTGRVLFENDRLIRIGHMGGGFTGYQKNTLKDIHRYALAPQAYYEQVGDFYVERLWDFENDLQEFGAAHRAYGRALTHETSERTAERIRNKEETLERERELWHREELRRIATRKAEEEAELTRLQRELAEKKLQAMEDTTRALGRLERRADALEADLRDLSRRHVHLVEIVEELEDDVGDFRRSQRYYVSSSLHLNLKRTVLGVERRVERLENRTRRD